jgi:hypothetical protein
MCVDAPNSIDHTKYIHEARNHLKTEFEMKDLSKTKFCLGLQLEHLHTGILVHQSAYIMKVLEKLNIDKAYSARTPMVVRTLEIIKNYLGRKKKEKRCWDQNTHT